MIFRKDLLVIFIPLTLLTVFCIGGCAEDDVFRMVYVVAIPTPQNLSTLQTSKCSGLLNVFELNRASKTVIGNHDFFYIYDYMGTMPQHLYRVSTNECFHYPEVFSVPESIKMACNKISEKKIINQNPSEGTATDISISFDLTEYDCSGVPFADELCVPCKSCPAKVICHVLTGTCLAKYVPQIPLVIDRNDEGSWCSNGYKNGNCSNICDPGTYGDLCSLKCSRHCVDVECHHKNGTCLKGCNPGWKGQECNKPDCPSNKFGPYCKYSCSPNCERDCNDEDGTCLCKPGLRDDRDGYTGLLCNNPCKPGTYGLGCSSKCEDCLQGTVCLPENGTCPNGCNEPGFYIRSSDLAKCDYIVDPQYTWLRTKCQRGTYGINCQKNCSTACRNSYCRNTDGICLDCPAGFRGPECSIECTPGTFGENCDKKCRCENGAVCDAASGRCPGKCIPGYEGTDCSRKACEPGTYGSKCDKWCFCKDNKPCDRDSGRCPVEDLCQKGWQFSKCDFRDVCLYPPDDPNEDDSPVSWNAASLAIGIVIGIVVTFVIVCCRIGYKKIMKKYWWA
ncbi:uncharacterized protein LOC111099147 [Crassostrea virginica]